MKPPGRKGPDPKWLEARFLEPFGEEVGPKEKKDTKDKVAKTFEKTKPSASPPPNKFPGNKK